MAFIKTGSPVKIQNLEVKEAKEDIEKNGKIIKAGKKYLEEEKK